MRVRVSDRDTIVANPSPHLRELLGALARLLRRDGGRLDRGRVRARVRVRVRVRVRARVRVRVRVRVRARVRVRVRVS